MLVVLAGCSAGQMAQDDTNKKGRTAMPSEIYSSRNPLGFEQIDVHEIVLKYIPIGSDKATVVATLKSMNVPDIHEKPDNMIYAEDRTGKAMLTPNARRIVMEFAFDEKNKLAAAKATYLKLQ